MSPLRNSLPADISYVKQVYIKKIHVPKPVT